MKKKLSLRLRAYYLLIVFAILLFSCGSATAVFLLLDYYGVSSTALNWVVALLVLSLLCVGLFSLFVGRRISAPMITLSEASREIAKGNYNITVSDPSKLEEVKTTFRNFNAMAQTLNSIAAIGNDFVANVSHEFKTPLTAIDGYATLLQEASLPEEERLEYLDKILYNTRRLSDLVGNILILSKIENQSIADQCSEFRLDEQIRQALVNLEPLWSAKNISFNVRLDSVSYRGCESLLLHAWMNIIGNAVKFSEEGQEIDIRLLRQTECVVITVKDRGCGMSPAVQERIFEKFFQGDPSRKSLGNGLGLPLAKRIVEIEDGLIEVDSAPNAGATFRIILPTK
ncbi:MAG: HAMP domain-containing histidine kinase [Oscillospiraceae bacterium]|jgi:signal transduction histidine kinase|nr:HAMP domain-containing histidine kinase [Oscillospiraceae bacterium]